MFCLLLILLAGEAIPSYGFPQNTLREGKTKGSGDPGKPLFLTPYIESGDIQKARQLARVKLNNSLEMMESYSGFFTVNKAYDSNQFVWYFPSMSSDKDKAPVVVWLQGGPGGTSMFGLLMENGPIAVNYGQFVPRKYHWALNHHVIYIDNPVGAGYSFTKKDEGYCTNEIQVGEQLYSTITQFFQLFPELQNNDFYITGESYAGKYVPAFAHTIHKKDSTAKSKINLRGLIIGGAYINPESQDKFSTFKFNSGHSVISLKESNGLKSKIKLYNDFDDLVSSITQNEVRKAIHVGDLSFDILNMKVWDYLDNDSSQSMAPWLSELLDHYPVTLYGGQYDQTVPYAGIVDFLRNHFNFTGEEEYKSAKQYSWRVDGELAGCVRRARLLTDIYVLNASHTVPQDQPKRTLDMITRLTHGKGFDQKETCPVTAHDVL